MKSDYQRAVIIEKIFPLINISETYAFQRVFVNHQWKDLKKVFDSYNIDRKIEQNLITSETKQLKDRDKTNLQ